MLVLMLPHNLSGFFSGLLRAPERGVVVVTQITITSQTANRKLARGGSEGGGGRRLPTDLHVN